LIQIYDTIIESGIKWVVAKHLEWTKLRAIAGVLHPENASHWIELASNHTKIELITLVQDHFAATTKKKSHTSVPARERR
jgi:hypothetical protein